MSKEELDIVRRVLEAALRNVEEDARNGNASEAATVIAHPPPTSSGQLTEAPIIVILAGEANDHLLQTTRLVKSGIAEAGPAASSVSDQDSKKLSHPGLERFTIEADSHPSAPKACFMEPGRTCVSSGACEMRGF